MNKLDYNFLINCSKEFSKNYLRIIKNYLRII